jgi:hypothetical protein
MADPISWLVLEPGHTVLTSDGEKLGTVKEVLGDTVADIFDGLRLTTGSLGMDETYVPSELIDSIDTEAVRLKIAAAESDRLDRLSPPGEATR